MGDSSGGNLAAVVSLMARDRPGPAIAHQVCSTAATDLTLSSPSIDENANAPVLSKAECTAFRDHYLGGQDPRQPYASPLHAADHTGLPPALVQVAEHFPIRDDGLRYAAALQAAGVPVRTTTYVGMPRGYLSFPRVCRSAPQALAEMRTELAAALVRQPSGLPGQPVPWRPQHPDAVDAPKTPGGGAAAAARIRRSPRRCPSGGPLPRAPRGTSRS
jgi:acetyl esterase/lipase